MAKLTKAAAYRHGRGDGLDLVGFAENYDCSTPTGALATRIASNLVDDQKSSISKDVSAARAAGVLTEYRRGLQAGLRKTFVEARRSCSVHKRGR